MSNFANHFGSEQRVATIRSMQCVIPGCYSFSCENAHIIPRASTSNSFRFIVPMCQFHHREYHHLQKQRFCHKYNITHEWLIEKALEIWI